MASSNIVVQTGRPLSLLTNIDEPGNIRVVERIDAVDPNDWNRLAGRDYPFVRHEFLHALECCHCVGEQSGWIPQHLLLERHGDLIGCAPMYVKWHSNGEFVFDWSWANAYAQAGVLYYPKLITAIPFIPAMGPRLLVGTDPGASQRRQALIAAGLRVAENMGVSSLHWLFTDINDIRLLEEKGLLIRTGCQFHWDNPGYQCFQDYLDRLTSKRRKQIRKERREAAQAPVVVEIIFGGDVTETQWHAYHRLYSSTYDRKWGYPALTLEFFEQIGHTMPDSILLILARRGDRYIAGAHCFQGGNTLYGRNWGCTEYYRSLHFELCYYRLIEHCIATGLRRIDAGAQGEHKLMRGFLPITTWSAHWIHDQRFHNAIAGFLRHERRDMEIYQQQMDLHSPFRHRIET